MRAGQDADVKKYFPILEGLLKDRKLPCEHGPARIVSVDEFMLMSVSEPLGTAGFKHRDTRNYVYVRRVNRQGVDTWTLDVPNSGEAFNLGWFDLLEVPCT